MYIGGFATGGPVGAFTGAIGAAAGASAGGAFGNSTAQQVGYEGWQRAGGAGIGGAIPPIGGACGGDPHSLLGVGGGSSVVLGGLMGHGCFNAKGKQA